MLSTLSTYFASQPKKLFLVDAIGAAISALLLAVVLPLLQPLFGLPPKVLYFLTLWPVLFILFDSLAYQQKFGTVRRNLRTIALCNACYCVLSLATVSWHAASVRPLGWAYIIGEVALVMCVAFIEWKSAKHLQP